MRTKPKGRAPKLLMVGPVFGKRRGEEEIGGVDVAGGVSGEGVNGGYWAEVGFGGDEEGPWGSRVAAWG